MEDAELKFVRICRTNGLQLEDYQIKKLQEYVVLLTNWNSKVNLISRAETSNVWLSHILHSVSLLFFVELQQNLRVADLGTGGGLPGIPLAIVRNDLNFTLIDSIRKKTTAVQDMVDRLGLTNVSVVAGRAEEIAREKYYNHKTDVVVSRAVAPLADLMKWSETLLRTQRQGTNDQIRMRRTFQIPYLLALKGGDLDQEINTARNKRKSKEITVVNLVFDGSEEIGLEGKKIVVVNM